MTEMVLDKLDKVQDLQRGSILDWALNAVKHASYSGGAEAGDVLRQHAMLL